METVRHAEQNPAQSSANSSYDTKINKTNANQLSRTVCKQVTRSSHEKNCRQLKYKKKVKFVAFEVNDKKKKFIQNEFISGASSFKVPRKRQNCMTIQLRCYFLHSQPFCGRFFASRNFFLRRRSREIKLRFSSSLNRSKYTFPRIIST